MCDIYTKQKNYQNSILLSPAGCTVGKAFHVLSPAFFCQLLYSVYFLRYEIIKCLYSVMPLHLDSQLTGGLCSNEHPLQTEGL